MLARELSRPLKLLIVAQPTRGLDVGSMEFVHRRIVAERDEGTAVVLVSTELDEVLGLADRIAVMYRGRIAGEVPAGTPAEEIGLLMAGQRRGRPRAMTRRRTGRRRGLTAAGERRRRRRRERRGCGRRLLDAYLYGNQIVVTLLAFLVRARRRRDPHRASPTRPPASRSATSSDAPGDTFSNAWKAISGGLRGAVPRRDLQHRLAVLQRRRAVFGPISDTLVNAAPLILGGLAVSVAFRAGLFNIGVQGQLIMGAICAGYVGFAWHAARRHPPPRRAARRHHSAGRLGRHRRVAQGPTGAHEVITTIMLNYVALYLLGYLLSVNGFQEPHSTEAISRTVHEPARLPHLFGELSCTPASSSRSWPRSAAGGCCRARRWASGCGPSARTRSPPGRPA